MMARARAGQHEGLAGARTGAPGDALAHDVEVARFGPAGAHQLEDGVDHALADRQAADQRLRRHQVGRRQRLRGDRHVVAPVVPIMIWRSAASSG